MSPAQVTLAGILHGKAQQRIRASGDWNLIETFGYRSEGPAGTSRTSPTASMISHPTV